MDIWLNLYNALLVIYLAYYSTIFKTHNIKVVVAIILIITSLNLLLWIIKKMSLRVIIILLAIGTVLYSGNYIWEMLYVFLAPLTLELFYFVKKENYFLPLLICLILLFLVRSSYFSSILLSFMFCLILYYCALYYIAKVNKYTSLNDELRSINEKVLKKISNQEDYENQVVYLTKLEERNKIAQEIHDKIGHTISGSIMQLEAASLLLNKDPEKTEKMMRSSIENLREGLEGIRKTLRRTKPEREQLGINRIKYITDSFMRSTGINVSLNYKGNMDDINFFYWKSINESIKECLTNSSKYSKCRNIKVNIEVLNKFIKAEVKDDGIGQENIKKGMGIKGIEERIEELDGKVIVDGSEGFSVILLIPINREVCKCQ